MLGILFKLSPEKMEAYISEYSNEMQTHICFGKNKKRKHYICRLLLFMAINLTIFALRVYVCRGGGGVQNKIANIIIYITCC